MGPLDDLRQVRDDDGRVGDGLEMHQPSVRPERSFDLVKVSHVNERGFDPEPAKDVLEEVLDAAIDRL